MQVELAKVRVTPLCDPLTPSDPSPEGSGGDPAAATGGAPPVTAAASGGIGAAGAAAAGAVAGGAGARTNAGGGEGSDLRGAAVAGGVPPQALINEDTMVWDESATQHPVEPPPAALGSGSGSGSMAPTGFAAALAATRPLAGGSSYLSSILAAAFGTARSGSGSRSGTEGSKAEAPPQPPPAAVETVAQRSGSGSHPDPTQIGTDVVMAEASPPRPPGSTLDLPPTPAVRLLPPPLSLLRCAYPLLQYSAFLLDEEWKHRGSSLMTQMATCLLLAGEPLPCLLDEALEVQRKGTETMSGYGSGAEPQSNIHQPTALDDGGGGPSPALRRLCLDYSLSAVRLSQAIPAAGRGGLLNPMYNLHALRLDWLLEATPLGGATPRGGPSSEEDGEDGEGGEGGRLGEEILGMVGSCCFRPQTPSALLALGSGSGSPLEARWRLLLEDCMAAMRWCIDVYRLAGEHHPARRQLAR